MAAGQRLPILAKIQGHGWMDGVTTHTRAESIQATMRCCCSSFGRRISAWRWGCACWGTTRLNLALNQVLGWRRAADQQKEERRYEHGTICLFCLPPARRDALHAAHIGLAAHTHPVLLPPSAILALALGLSAGGCETGVCAPSRCVSQFRLHACMSTRSSACNLNCSGVVWAP